MRAFLVNSTGNEFWRKRQLVRHLLPFLDWRWHGVGMLQAYVREGDPELRIHIWSPELVMEGIDTSGNIHDHRFDLCSDVLIGRIQHTEYELESNGKNGTHTIWRLEHNARRQLKIKTQGSDDMVEEPQAYLVSTKTVEFAYNQSYVFPKRFYHQTKPLSTVAVTLVTKSNQDDRMAGILCPIGKPPVPAFGRPLSDISQKAKQIISYAKEALKAGP